MDDKINITAIIEGALFLSSEPLPVVKIAKLCNCTVEEIKKQVALLQKKYDKEDSALTILETQDGYLLGTKPMLANYLAKLYEEKLSPFLSQAALETLAVIAYKQPVTRPEIEKIRGVNSEAVLENLLKRKLIKTAGRRDVPGRPLLYATTDNFLRYFGLKSLDGLPPLEEIEKDNKKT
ncbi:MAG: SMC-Scp complex subunit ScpB [Firmicutes bacterium]|nr:SMC-Scp complex subunit ScpB [Bacillota bacterium]